MDYISRINRLRQNLQEIACQAILIENTLDIFYLTGQKLSLGKLVVTAEDAYLLVDSRYYESCAKSAPCTVLLTPDNTAAKLLIQHGVETLGFDSDHTSYRSYLDFEAVLKEHSSAIKLIPLSNPIKKLREVKDLKEIELLREAAHLGSLGFDYVCSLLSEGISEEEVAVELEIFWRRKGGQGVAFDPIIAFGANSSMPHYRAGKTRLAKGQCVLIDIGVHYQNYHSDMTRVVFLESLILKYSKSTMSSYKLN